MELSTLANVCEKLFGFTPDEAVLSENSELITVIISSGQTKEAVAAFYDYLSGKGGYATKEACSCIMSELREHRALCLIDAFTVPLNALIERYELDKKRHAAYNYYCDNVIEERYPHNSEFSNYLLMICQCMNFESHIAKKFSEH